jgi:hypothetical protein
VKEHPAVMEGTAGCSFAPLPHPGDLTGMSEPCGALPRKCLFIYTVMEGGSIHNTRSFFCGQSVATCKREVNSVYVKEQCKAESVMKTYRLQASQNQEL